MFKIFKNLVSGLNSNDALKEVLTKDTLLLDVRSVQEFNSGSVKGAINIPLDQLEKHLEKCKSKEHIVVFCRSGARSAQAKAILNKNGFQSVINGGSWQNVQSMSH